jgi:ankyrin repeat protein
VREFFEFDFSNNVRSACLNAGDNNVRIRQLFSRDFPPLQPGGTRFTFLELALLVSPSIVSSFLKHDQSLDLNLPFLSSGMTPLEIAIRRRNISMVKVLTEARDNQGRPRVDVNRWSPLGYPVHLAAALYLDGREILELLYNAGADFRVVHNGVTPLEVARIRATPWNGEYIERVLAAWSWRNTRYSLHALHVCLLTLMYNLGHEEDSYCHIPSYFAT